MNENMLRVSDADRDAAISELGEHFQAGRLDPAELEDRTGRALRARIGSELDELLADLPRRPQALARPQPPARRRPARQPPARRRPALVPFAIPLLVAAGLTAAVLTAAEGGGWHHQWAFGWALWWVVPVLAMRMLWWRRSGGARPWR